MDMNRKLQLAKLHIDSISQADDVDGAVRGAALDHLIEHIGAERAAATKRTADRIAASLAPPAQEPTKRAAKH